jgi:hypothetical protein
MGKVNLAMANFIHPSIQCYILPQGKTEPFSVSPSWGTHIFPWVADQRSEVLVSDIRELIHKERYIGVYHLYFWTSSAMILVKWCSNDKITSLESLGEFHAERLPQQNRVFIAAGHTYDSNTRNKSGANLDYPGNKLHDWRARHPGQ